MRIRHPLYGAKTEEIKKVLYDIASEKYGEPHDTILIAMNYIEQLEKENLSLKIELNKPVTFGEKLRHQQH